MSTKQLSQSDHDDSRGFWPATLGLLFSAAFYAVVYAVPWSPLQRYFLGHPIAIATAVLFWIAVSILLCRWIALSTQRSQLHSLRDEDLLPMTALVATPAERFQAQHNVGVVSKAWLDSLNQLPPGTRNSQLIRRLHELLARQSQRGTTKHLADDLREVSARESDGVHDAYSLVRIIVWAIPMLGFLGTVVGITQTLGGLDFTDGTAAVDRLKSGLYVAFDTTALGIVLSVLAIFLQFPVERGEQNLHAAIDSRVGKLLAKGLPSDDVADNQMTLVANLCEGIRVAVAESIAQQTDLWRSTIDAAHQRWQDIHQSTASQITAAFSEYLTPALRQHAGALNEASLLTAQRWEQHCQAWQETLAEHSERVVNTQQALLQHCESLSTTTAQAESLVVMQQTLDANLVRLQETNAAVDRSVAAAAGDGMADAMRMLSRAVDVLSLRLHQDNDMPNRSVQAKQILNETISLRRAA